MKFLVSIPIVWFFTDLASAQFFQYFYSAPTPILPQFQTPFYQPQLIPQPQPYFFQPQIYQTPYAESKQNPTVLSKTQVQRNQLATFPASKNYRGFGYHTDFGDGASSTVVFFTGGPSNPNIHQPLSEKITVASDSLDPQIPFSIEERLHNIYEENQPSTESETTSNASNNQAIPSLTPVIKSFFEHPESLNQVLHFYSEPGYPASTAPLIVSGRSRALNLDNLTSTTNITTKSSKDEAPSDLSLSATTLNATDNENTENNTTESSDDNLTSLSTDASYDEANTEEYTTKILANSNASEDSQGNEKVSTEESNSNYLEDQNISTTDSDIETTLP